MVDSLEAISIVISKVWFAEPTTQVQIGPQCSDAVMQLQARWTPMSVVIAPVTPSNVAQ